MTVRRKCWKGQWSSQKPVVPATACSVVVVKRGARRRAPGRAMCGTTNSLGCDSRAWRIARTTGPTIRLDCLFDLTILHGVDVHKGGC